MTWSIPDLTIFLYRPNPCVPILYEKLNLVLYWEPRIWCRLKYEKLNTFLIKYSMRPGNKFRYSPPVNGWSKSQPWWQWWKASRRQAPISGHPSFCSPRPCLLPLVAHLAPGVNINCRIQKLPEFCIQICQNRDLRGISSLLGCSAVAEVGGGHRSFLLLLQIVPFRRNNVHGAGVRPISRRLVWSLCEWGRASITGAAWVGDGGGASVGDRGATGVGVSGWWVIRDGTPHLVLGRFGTFWQWSIIGVQFHLDNILTIREFIIRVENFVVCWIVHSWSEIREKVIIDSRSCDCPTKYCNTVSVFLQQSALVQTICKICKRGILVSIFALMLKTLARWQPWIFCGQSVCQFRFDFVLHWEPVDSCILLCKNIGIGIDCGSNDALHPFWGLFLGLQPSRSAARPRPQEKCIQRIILTTVANTQREGSHTIR